MAEGIKQMGKKIIKRKIEVFINKICPKLYNSIVFRHKVGYWCNYENPKTFNEKVQWRKYHQHDSRFPALVDKYSVRDYVEQRCPGILVENYSVYSNIDEIDFNELPDSFIIKPTHGFGELIFCEDKSKLDIEKCKKTMKGWLRYNQYNITGEWQYKDIEPRIIFDALLGSNISDYKIFCFYGKPYMIQIDSDRYSGEHKRQLRTIDWKLIDCQLSFYQKDEREIEKPKKLKEMLEICEKLSSDFDFVRVDLFYVDDNIYFSELTFTPGNGMLKFTPYEWDLKFGEKWKVPVDESKKCV